VNAANAAMQGVRSLGAALEDLVGTTPDLLLRHSLWLDGRRSRLSRHEYLARLACYADETHLHERRFFARLPDRAPAPAVLSRSAYRGGEELLLRFESSYRAFNPVMASELARFAANRDGYLLLLRHDEGRPRPLVLCVHGFQMGAPERAKKLFRIAHLFDLGLDVALFIQPHHWRRAEHPNNPLKQSFVNPHDVPLTIEALGQAVHDLRASYLLLESLGHTRIAMVGASLGGYACALHAVVDDSPACVYVAVPSLRMDFTLAPRRLKLGFPVDDEVREMTTRALDLVAPANYAPTLSADAICVVYHQADRIADARHTREWIARWGIEHHTALHGGHWAVFDRKARGRAFYAWLARHDFIAPHRRGGS
jgi:hypothetical protein